MPRSGGDIPPVVLVTFRGPLEHTLGNDGVVRTPATSGGLVSGLLGLPEIGDVAVWLCAAMSDLDRKVAQERRGESFRTTVRDTPVTVRMLALDPHRQWLTSNVAANPLLWFLHHSMWDVAFAPAFGAAEHAAFRAYADTSAAVADAVIEELDRLGPEAVVMLHDYQLFLVAERVRACRPNAALTHFVHVPWPAPDTWRLLPSPWRERLLRGLLANDLVGLHTRGYVESFLACCEELLDAKVDRDAGLVVLEDHQVAVRAYPLSPHPAALRRLARSPDVVHERTELRRARPERLVVRVDRADPTKNILRGFQAWETLLLDHPEHQGRAVMRAVVQPTRQDVPAYREYLAAVQTTADALNVRLGTSTWQPVDLVLTQGHASAVAALQEYDVLLVNPIRDGMNLVAKEGVLLNKRNGVLVLSELAGAHDELGPWALGVHPLDVSAQAAALHEALTMPHEERRARLVGARALLERHDARRWYAEQLCDVQELCELSSRYARSRSG